MPAENRIIVIKGLLVTFCYPEKTVYGGQLGSRVMGADFIIRRYLKGSSIPLHFVGFSAKKRPLLRYFMHIHSLIADDFINACDHFFDHFEVPQTLKLDNAATFIGSLSGKRTLSQTMIYLSVTDNFYERSLKRKKVDLQ